MKKLVLVVLTAIVLVTLVVSGCANEETAVTPGKGEEVVSSCITCHTDKDTLKEVASPEPAEEESEATSGEG